MQFKFNRRRYGYHTYTWAFVIHNNEWLSLGDPWPGVNWPKKELEKFGRIAIEEQKTLDASIDTTPESLVLSEI